MIYIFRIKHTHTHTPIVVFIL